ncbi:hypothetical protein ACQP2F_03585 [Actinoplanes sp. CA-030573]|uniref:hypothetical protein n=1 Tax=Actinoplanes sp. CA-030573 TaxID=3239898 RepID=UPI003D8E2757
MSARKLGRFAGVVFALAVALVLGSQAAAQASTDDASASPTAAVQAQTLLIEWE